MLGESMLNHTHLPCVLAIEAFNACRLSETLTTLLMNGQRTHTNTQRLSRRPLEYDVQTRHHPLRKNLRGSISLLCACDMTPHIARRPEIFVF